MRDELCDGLQDLAVVRTTLETLEVFPDDAALRTEMEATITLARERLVKRLEALRDLAWLGAVAFPEVDPADFRDQVLHLVLKGGIRRTLDSMMKVDVFVAVGKAEASLAGRGAEPFYRYALRPENPVERMLDLSPTGFVTRLLEDLRATVADERYYDRWLTFDKEVFQKYVTLLFATFTAADPTFREL